MLEDLDKPNTHCADEIWFDSRSSDTYLRNVPFRSYMWRRSRYYVDAFLSFAGNVSDPVARATTGVARLSNELAKDMLRSRLSQALGTRMSDPSALASLPELKSTHSESQRIGFVGVMLDKDVGSKFIEGLRIPEGIGEKTKEDAGNLMSLLQGFARAGHD
jgi:hypothetical protein